MTLPFARAVFAISLLAMPLQAAPTELGKQFFHKDWAAACDNTLSCEAVSLMNDSQDDSMPTISVFRANDAVGSVQIKISIADPKGDRYRVPVSYTHLTLTTSDLV